MEKEILKKVTFCDVCEKENYVASCPGCGKQVCYECRKREGREYAHAVYFSGSCDGYFCNQCIEKPPEKIVPLLTSYQKIASLCAEQKGWSEDFEKRIKIAEKTVKMEREKLNL